MQMRVYEGAFCEIYIQKYFLWYNITDMNILNICFKVYIAPKSMKRLWNEL